MMSVVRSALFFSLLSLLPALLAACAASRRAGTSSSRATPPSQVTRAAVLATAMRYASHPWTGRATHVRHGVDRAGIRIDTPDVSYQKPGAVPGFWVPGRVTYGIPYQWGGFSSPEEFDRGLAAGLAAGDVYTEQKRALLHKAVSAEAVGIDCSGFISRCWALPRACSTRELGDFCDILPSWNDLRPGDALNLYNAHVLLFSGWTRPDREFLAAYETGGPPDWKVIRHVIHTGFLKRKGYRPLRYRGIRDG
jgi:hypothetical protein